MKAIDYILNTDNQRVIIFTDSLSSILTIKQMYTKNPLAQIIQQTIHKIISNKRIITLYWIPSHIGIVGNEIADSLANRATNLSTQVNTVTCFDAIGVFRRLLCKKWEMDWTQVRDNKLRNNKPHTRCYTAFESRRHQLAITRILIGHHSWMPA